MYGSSSLLAKQAFFYLLELIFDIQDRLWFVLRLAPRSLCSSKYTDSAFIGTSLSMQSFKDEFGLSDMDPAAYRNETSNV